MSPASARTTLAQLARRAPYRSERPAAGTRFQAGLNMNGDDRLEGGSGNDFYCGENVLADGCVAVVAKGRGFGAVHLLAAPFLLFVLSLRRSRQT